MINCILTFFQEILFKEHVWQYHFICLRQKGLISTMKSQDCNSVRFSSHDMHFSFTWKVKERNKDWRKWNIKIKSTRSFLKLDIVLDWVWKILMYGTVIKFFDFKKILFAKLYPDQNLDIPSWMNMHSTSRIFNLKSFGMQHVKE